ncbi:MAG: PQQ-binding-like beta-propeller repeat protein [bacterium]|nr:PQQ-binding-like beta-propeller repeat protein [bacterium]
MKIKNYLNTAVFLYIILLNIQYANGGAYNNLMVKNEIQLASKLVNEPVIYNKVLYYTLQYRLYAVNVETGKTLWVKEYDDNFCTSPVVDDNSVLIGSANYKLCSFSVKDGEREWEVQSEGVVNSIPVVDGHNVYFLGFDGKIYNIDLTTGYLIWKLEIEPRGFSGNITPSLILNNNNIYGVTYNGKVFAVNYIDGEVHWIMDLGTNVESTPVIKENNIYICTYDGEIIVINNENGELLWKVKISSKKIINTPVFYGDLLIVPSSDSNVYGVNINERKVEWTYDLKSVPGYGKLAMLGDAIVINTKEKVIALDPNKGGEIYAISHKDNNKDNNIPVYSFPYLIYWGNDYIHVYELIE